MPVYADAEPESHAELKRHDYIKVVRAFAQKNKTKHRIRIGNQVVVVHPVGADNEQLVLELPRPKGMKRSRSAKINICYLYPGGFTAEFYGFTWGAQQKWVDIASAEFKSGYTGSGLFLGVLGALLSTASELENQYAQAAAEPEARVRASAERALALLHKTLATPKTVVVAGVSVIAARATPQRGFADASDITLKLHHSPTKDFVAVVDLGMFDPPDLYVTIKGRKPVPYEDYPMSPSELLRFAATKLVEQVYGTKFMTRNGAVQAAAEPESKDASTSRAVRIYEKLYASLPPSGKEIKYKNNTFTVKTYTHDKFPDIKYIVIVFGKNRLRLVVTAQHGPSLRDEVGNWRLSYTFEHAILRAQSPEAFLRTVFDAVLWFYSGYVTAAAEPEEYAGAEKRWLKAVRALPKEGVRVRFAGRETTVTPERNHLGEIGIGFDFYYEDVCYRISVLSHGSKLKIHSYHPVLYVRHDVFAIPLESGADLLRAVLALVVRKLSLPGAVTSAAEPASAVQERLLHLHDSLRSKYGRRPLLLPIGDDRRLRVDTGLEMEPNKHVTINYQDDNGSTLGHVVFFCLTRPGEPDRVACYFTQGGIRHDRRDFTVTESDLRRLVDDNSTLKFLVGKAKAMLLPKSAHRPTAAAEPAAGFETVFLRTWEVLDKRATDLRVDVNGLEVVVHAGRDFSNKPNIFVNVCRGSVDLEMFTFTYVIGIGLRYTQGRSKWETCKTLRGKPVEDIQRIDAFLAGLVNFTYTLTEAKAGT